MYILSCFVSTLAAVLCGVQAFYNALISNGANALLFGVLAIFNVGCLLSSINNRNRYR